MTHGLDTATGNDWAKGATAVRARAAIYARISRDADGEKVGVERQLKDCRELAKRLGYEVAEEYVDNDISASSKKKKVRPGYNSMFAGARRGEFTAIIAYSNSRLTRRLMELEEIIRLHEQTGVQVHTVVSGNDDLSTADGRMTARIKASVDAGEAERIAERTKRAKAEMATKGDYRGGRRPYGYNKDGITIREAEARVIRESASSVLSGRTLAAVARDLNDKGLKTSTGKPWTYARLRDVLIRPRNAALIGTGRADRREVEIVGKAAWKPILDEDTWRAVYDLLTDPSRRSPNQTTEPKWLGSGIYVCGRCGGAMRATPFGGTASRRNHVRTYHYRCSEAAHLTVHAGKTDEYVLAVVADLVRDPRVRAALVPKAADMGEDRERRAVLDNRLRQVEVDYDEDLIDARRYRAKRDKIRAEIEDIDSRLARASRRSKSQGVLGGPDPGDALLSAPLDVQRAILRMAVEVKILPNPVRGKQWSPGRVQMTTKGTE